MSIKITDRPPSFGKKEQWVETGSGLAVPFHVAQDKRPIAVDFFAGCGGFSLGLLNAGFRIIAAFELDIYAAHTYMHNLGDYPIQIHYADEEIKERFCKYIEKAVVKRNAAGQVVSVQVSGSNRPPHFPGVSHFFLGDMRKWTAEQILSIIGLKRGELDLVVGGPPCQGFSRAGKQDVMDPRNSLVFDFAKMIVGLWPKSMVMEEVPDVLRMVTPEGIPVIDAFCRILEDGNYSSYESLKRSLVGNPKARGAVRTNASNVGKKKKKKKSKKTKSPPTLFDMSEIR